MSRKVAQKLDFTEGALGENGLFKDLGDLLDGHILSCLGVLCSAINVQKEEQKGEPTRIRLEITQNFFAFWFAGYMFIRPFSSLVSPFFPDTTPSIGKVIEFRNSL